MNVIQLSAERDITEEIKPYVKAIVSDSEGGDLNAQAVIQFHRMHVASSQDPGAYAFCCNAFDVWLDRASRHAILQR